MNRWKTDWIIFGYACRKRILLCHTIVLPSHCRSNWSSDNSSGSDQILLKFLHSFRIYGSTVPFNLDYFQFCCTRIMGLDPVKIVNVLHAFSSVLWTIFFKPYLPDYKEWWSESLYTFWHMFTFVAQELWTSIQAY